MLFVCEDCHCVDVIELAYPTIDTPPQHLRCTQCQGYPWHHHFPKMLYNPDKDIVINRPSGIGLQSN